MSITLITLLGLSTIFGAAIGVLQVWWFASPSPALDDLSLNVGLLLIVITLATIPVFLTYLYRARINAEAFMTRVKHRHKRVMVIVSWLGPVEQFWQPKQVVDDIWLASCPDTPNCPDTPKPGLVRTCWIAFAGFWTLAWTAVLLSFLSPSRFSRWFDSLLPASFCVTYVAAGILAILVVRRLTSFQQTRLRTFRPGRPADSGNM